MSEHPVTVAHDAFLGIGGAERVADLLLRLLPDAPLVAGAIAPAAWPPSLGERPVHTSFLQPLARDPARSRALFAAWPLAFRRLPVPPSDVLLTSSSAFAHQLRPGPGTVHVWYCHTPPRFAWDPDAYFRGRPGLAPMLRPWLDELRRLDLAAARRVDRILANSTATAARIRAVYGRGAEVVHPPVDLAAFRPTRERTGRFLVVSRLLGYKDIDLAIDAAGRLGVGLDIIGDGPDRRRLERRSWPGTRFLGRVSDTAAREAMARAAAVIVPGIEDFGLVVVEAQASGRPPIVAPAGGALDIVTDGVDGYRMPEHSVDGLVSAMERALTGSLDPERLRRSAERFGLDAFRLRLSTIIADAAGAPSRAA